MIAATETLNRVSLAYENFVSGLNTIVFSGDIINTTVLVGKLSDLFGHSGGYFF